MSSVNYSLKHKGVRLLSTEQAWVKGKNGKLKLNPKYRFVGRMDTKLPNIIITTSGKRKPHFKGDTASLNDTAKGQIVDHFYDKNGKRNKRTVAYFGVEKKNKDK